MHIPLPFGAITRRLRSGYSYFRTGVHVEGHAHLCDDEHLLIYAGGEWPKAPQHVDVTAEFWNRRNDRVTVIEIVRAEITTYGVELIPDGSADFKPVTLEVGDPPVETSFRKGVPRIPANNRVFD